MSSNADNTARKPYGWLTPYQYVKGERSGNPRGRPRGSRNQFSKQFIADLAEVWNEGGIEILRHAAVQNPLGFAALASQLVPKDHGVETPKQGVGFQAIWERMGAGTVPNMESPADIEEAEVVEPEPAEVSRASS